MARLIHKIPLQNSRRILTRNTIYKVMLFLFTILLAGFLGNFIALLATKQITDMLARFIVGIIIGLLVGIAVGIVIKRTWEKIQLYFSKGNHNKNII